MSIPTVAVTCTINGQDGQPVEGAVVTAKLTADDVYNGFVVKRSVTGTTDATGVVVLDLFPNALGTNGSQYEIRVITPERTLRFIGTVPNQACDLSDIMDVAPAPPLSLAEQAQLICLQARDVTVTAQEAAEDAQTEAETAALTATAQAGLAASSASVASTAKADAETAQEAAEDAADDARVWAESVEVGADPGNISANWMLNDGAFMTKADLEALIQAVIDAQ